ncbi:hypothetical protein BGZ88_001313 [Linnemannia elongata]|nr:hypothetical protein BGZ88_001313 [Linnemannia elongata]
MMEQGVSDDARFDCVEQVNLGRERNGIQPIPADDESITALLQEDTFLCALAISHPNFHPAQHPKVLAKANDEDESLSDGSIRFYLRHLRISKDLFQNYHDNYADKDWAKAMLDRFPVPDKEVSVFYIGFTTRSPTERATEDQKSTPPSRLGNLLNIVGQEVDTYEWVELSQPCGVTKADYRRHLVGQDIERNLIALGGPFLANSASGGFTYDWAVPVHLREELGRFQEYVQYHSHYYNTASASRSSSHPATQNLLALHFQHMRNHFLRNQRPGETVATDECLKELVDAGSRPVMVKNQVISAFVTKDSTLEALAGGFAYDGDTAGPAPRLEHHLRKCVAEIVKDQIDGDVFPQSQDSQNQFMASLEQGHYTHASLEAAAFGQEIARSWTNIKSDSNYVEALGRLSVVKFGPGQDDYCLLLPERHTGNMRYNPPLSAAFSKLSFLTKCMYLVAIPHLVAYAQNPRPGSRQDTLVQLMNEIEGSVQKCGVRLLIEDARDLVKILSKEAFRQRTQTANTRKADDDPEGYDNWLRTRLDQLEAGRREKEVFAIGSPHSAERKVQIDHIFAREDDFQRRGVVVNIPEIPRGLDSREAQHRFLMARPQGVGLIKFDKRTFYYYYARCEICSSDFVGQDKRPHKCLGNKNSDKERLTILRHFLYPHDLFACASEEEKADVMEWIDDYESAVDKIPEADTPEGPNPRELARQAIETNGAPQYRPALPLLEDLGEGQGQVAYLDDVQLEQIGSQIIFTPASFGNDSSLDKKEKRWLMTMAVDILLSVANRCTIAQVPEDDNWCMFLRSRRSADRAFDYFAEGRREWDQAGGKGRKDRSPKILVPPFMGVCVLDSSCGSMKIFFPKDGNSLKKSDRKHSCGSYEKPSKIVKGTWMHNFMELPEAAVRTIWFANWVFYDADDDHSAFLNWSFTVEEKSAVARWYETDPDQHPDDYAVLPIV